jgi:hypothetical protein
MVESSKSVQNIHRKLGKRQPKNDIECDPGKFDHLKEWKLRYGDNIKEARMNE